MIQSADSRRGDPHPLFLGNPTCLPEVVAAAWRHLRTLPFAATIFLDRRKAAIKFCVRIAHLCTYLRIPTKPAMHSNMKPAAYSDLKPVGVPI